jgi:tetratricopeptide (TPR) repeat protein
MSRGECAQARIIARHLTDLQPGDAYAWYLRGVVFLELSEPEQAEPCLLKSMEIQETDGWDCYQMSRVRLLLGDLQGAVDWCSRAMTLEPDKPPFTWQLMKIQSIRGDLDAAIAVGIEALSKMGETDETIRTRLMLAKLYISTSAFDEAVAQLQEALKLKDSHVELWSTLGHCLSRQNKTAEALKVFQIAAEIAPNDPNNLYNIADAYLGLGQPNMAIGPLLYAVQLKHDFSLAHYDLSLAYLMMMKYHESEMAARAALRDDPEMEFQRSNRGMGATENLGLALMNQGRLEEAEACFRRNLGLFAKTYFNLGLTLFKAKRYDEALENFRRALELEPEDPEYHNLLGQTQDELGHPVEAEKSLRHAIKIAPSYALGHYDLGAILAKREGRKKEAFAVFERALKIDPDLAPAYYGIACLHALAGKEVPALAFLAKALRKGFRDLAYIEKDADWDGLKANPKFTRLLRKCRDMEGDGRTPTVPRRRVYRTSK